jgi:hypothetical protein
MKPLTGLMDANKLFLSQVVTAVNRLFPNLKQQQQMRKINIGDEDLSPSFMDNNEPIVAPKFVPFFNENIVPSFKDKSGQILAPPLKDTSGTLKNVDFSDKKTDEKITEMQALIAETMAKRNFEVEQFEISNNSNLSSESETWLQSAKTSVKTDKQNDNNANTNDTEQRKLKYNSFSKNQNQNQNQNQKQNQSKKVTWSNKSNI